MKATKTLLIAALAAGALFAGSSALLAQDATNPPPPGMKGARHDFAKELNLTDDQKPKFQAVMKDAMDQRKALRDDTSMTPEDKKAKGKAIQEEMTSKMKELLTAEQFAKWQELTKRGPRNHPPGGSDAPKAPKFSSEAPNTEAPQP